MNKKTLIISITCILCMPVLAWAYSDAFVYNPKTLQWIAYNSAGQIVASGKGSGGSHYCRDIGRSCKTPIGTFSVKSKQGAGCKSSRYPVGHPGAPMPYCAFFTKFYAVHGSYEVPNYNASHGCIRIKPAAAKWLSTHFFHVGTKVVVLPY